MEITLGLPDPFAVSMPRLEQVFKGIKVWQGRQGQNKPNQKLPISPEILRQMKSLWLPHERDPTFIMLWAASCICFFGFLRSGELTVPSQFGYDLAMHLSIRDVAVDDHEHPTMVQLSLKSSKTDPFWRGVQIVIGSTQDDLCPVAALLAYLAVQGGSPGPLLPAGSTQSTRLAGPKITLRFPRLLVCGFALITCAIITSRSLHCCHATLLS